MSYTLLKSFSEAVCCPSQAAVMPNSGNICGKNIKTLLKDLSSDSPIKKTIAVAALNALSQTCYERSGSSYATKFKADPFDELAIKRSSFSVIAGVLASCVKFIIKNGLIFAL
ncbi:DUF4213 domain-containing protein [Campylobacter showae]|uniref:DUF4213 domain-containing protein n=1 Tax=Campylobacter showae TaxID=204 RepID=UPI001F137FA9|nr:DUF4213 domain-containing protein [Campylobacter showae]